MGWLCDGHFNEGAHSYIMGCLEPGSWNAVVLAWSGCVDDAATRWRRHSYIMGWVKVNFWLRGPRLTASCHWNVPECGTSGSSVDYANVLGGGWFGTFIVVLVLVFFFPPSVVD